MSRSDIEEFNIGVEGWSSGLSDEDKFFIISSMLSQFIKPNVSQYQEMKSSIRRIMEFLEVEPNLINHMGVSLLMFALAHSTEAAKLMLELGADINKMWNVLGRERTFINYLNDCAKGATEEQKNFLFENGYKQQGE